MIPLYNWISPQGGKPIHLIRIFPTNLIIMVLLNLCSALWYELCWKLKDSLFIEKKLQLLHLLMSFWVNFNYKWWKVQICSWIYVSAWLKAFDLFFRQSSSVLDSGFVQSRSYKNFGHRKEKMSRGQKCVYLLVMSMFLIATVDWN